MAAKRGARMPKPTPDAPQEVVALLKGVRRRLAGAADRWTLEQWHRELVHLRRLSVRHKLRLHQAHRDVIELPDGSVGVIGAWPTVVRVDPPVELPAIGDTFAGPLLVYPDRSGELPPEAGPLLVYPGQVSVPRLPEALEHRGFLLPWDQCPALVIRLVGASEEHIRAKAMAALDEALRKRAALERGAGSPLPRMQTERGFSRPFADRTAFGKWRAYSISELAEMLAWKKSLPEVERKMYPTHVLGWWIGGDHFTAQRTSDARKVLRDAIACIPLMLTEQLEGGATAS